MANNGSALRTAATLWDGPKSGPIFLLRNYFSGTQTACRINIQHYENQHVIGGREISLDVRLNYDPDSYKEIVHGNGATAFEILFHMGVTPVAHVWERLYERLSSTPKPIKDMSVAEVAKFLGVPVGQDKDKMLTCFVRTECQTRGYHVPEALPFCHEFKIGVLEPPKCEVERCHTCRPTEEFDCECHGCFREPCYCTGCKALRDAQNSPSEQPCLVCEEKGRGSDPDCPTCGTPLTPPIPSTPGADLKTVDTESEYVELMKSQYDDFLESRRVEGSSRGGPGPSGVL